MRCGTYSSPALVRLLHFLVVESCQVVIDTLQAGTALRNRQDGREITCMLQGRDLTRWAGHSCHVGHYELRQEIRSFGTLMAMGSRCETANLHGRFHCYCCLLLLTAALMNDLGWPCSRPSLVPACERGAEGREGHKVKRQSSQQARR